MNGAMPHDQTHERKRRRFFAALFALTALPLLVLPLMATIDIPFSSSVGLGFLIFAAGGGHVASTASVYVDRSVREVMRPMPLRFVVVPAVSIVATLGAVAWGANSPLPAGPVAGLYMFHLGWLHYHYQRQNYGIIAFSAASAGNRVPRYLDRVVLLPALAGCLAVMPVFIEDAFPNVNFWRPLAPLFQPAARIAFALGVAGLLALGYRRPEAFRHPRTVAFVAASFTFFLPALLLEQTDYAFWSYALAHGFQYLFMVFILGHEPAQRLLHSAWYFACALLGGLALHRLVGNHALFAAGIVLTWVHFVLDARLWKMSDPGPRELLKERFDFIFGATTS